LELTKSARPTPEVSVVVRANVYWTYPLLWTDVAPPTSTGAELYEAAFVVRVKWTLLTRAPFQEAVTMTLQIPSLAAVA
jgi:hypothetical protein